MTIGAIKLTHSHSRGHKLFFVAAGDDGELIILRIYHVRQSR